MTTALKQVLFIEEIADFLASTPSREQILGFHPSAQVEERFGELLHKTQDSQLTREERDELTQFHQAEILLRLLKARLRSNQAMRP